MTLLTDLEKATRKLEDWEAEKASSPTIADLDARTKELQDAEALYQEMLKDYRISVVKRALTHGWVEVGKELDILPRTIHAWHKKYCPELTDVVKEYKKYETKRTKLLVKLSEQKRAAESEAKLIEQFISKEN